MAMVPRRTFVVQIREPDPGLVVEDVRYGERVRLDELAELPELLEQWMGDEREPEPTVGAGEEA